VPLHIGYPTVEALAADLAAGQVVYVLPTAECVDTFAQVRTFAHRVWVQAKAGRDVLYCAVPTGHSQQYPGAEKDPAAGAADARNRSACDLIGGFLASLGLRPKAALIARPKDLKMLDGDFRGMRYDKATDRFVPATVGIAIETLPEDCTPSPAALDTLALRDATREARDN
jgi:hypothetical protein